MRTIVRLTDYPRFSSSRITLKINVPRKNGGGISSASRAMGPTQAPVHSTLHKDSNGTWRFFGLFRACKDQNRTK